MGSHPKKKRSLDTTGREAVLSRMAGFLAGRHSGILSAYVFGSFAREEAFEDLDVALLMAQPLADPLPLELEIEGDLEKLMRLPVDVRILNRAPKPFQYTVIREGRLFLDRDPNRRAAFEGNVIKQYLDFARFRIRSLKELARAGI
jgi:predicted nucleotidyltransferase